MIHMIVESALGHVLRLVKQGVDFESAFSLAVKASSPADRMPVMLNKEYIQEEVTRLMGENITT
ncbi:MAG: hypothetical protein V1895_02370 [Parcubacteria group bacterium]